MYQKIDLQLFEGFFKDTVGMQLGL
uniref:Uncharacterized protein n=1 Tax=Anguilla anguilla TaxID=7936 RepID=A0A0E9R3T3_ANGAN